MVWNTCKRWINKKKSLSRLLNYKKRKKKDKDWKYSLFTFLILSRAKFNANAYDKTFTYHLGFIYIINLFVVIKIVIYFIPIVTYSATSLMSFWTDALSITYTIPLKINQIYFFKIIQVKPTEKTHRPHCSPEL